MLKDKSKIRRRKTEQVFTDVFENGVLKPLAEMRLPKRKKLTVPNGRSIAAQMYGLFKFQNQERIDEIIEAEDWL